MTEISSVPERVTRNERGDFDFPETPIHALPPCVPLTLSKDTQIKWDVNPELRRHSRSVLENPPVDLAAGARI